MVARWYLALAVAATTLAIVNGLFVCQAVHGPTDPRPAARVMTTNCDTDVAAINAIVGNGSHYRCHSDIHNVSYRLQIAPGEPMITATFLMTSLCPQTAEYGGAEEEDDINLVELDAAIGNGADFRCGHHRAPVGGALGHQYNWYSIVAAVCPRTDAQIAAMGPGSVALANQVQGVDPYNPRLGTNMPTQAPAPTNPAPTTVAPVTSAPTSASPTRAILNTFTDCGGRHLNCTQRLTAPYVGDGDGSGPISCAPTAGGQCVCVGEYHCHGTLTLGRCRGVDTCLERDMTDAPTSAPTTTEPTTPLPSQAPVSSVPTPEPTFLPSLSDPTHAPTKSPTTAVPTKFPTTAAPTATAETQRNTAAGDGDAAGSDDATTFVAVVIVVALLVLATIGGAVVYVKSSTRQGRGAGQATGFDNPMYASTEEPIARVKGHAKAQGQGQGFDGYMEGPADTRNGQQQSSGYMDVQPQTDSSSGYMDVPAADNDAEDV